MKNKKKQQKTPASKRHHSSYILTFRDHLLELRKRFAYVSLSVIVFASIAYGVQKQLVSWLLLPAHQQSFIYTSPLDGINFIFKVCIYSGIVISLPVIIFQLLKFIEPILKIDSSKFILRWSVMSALLAMAGIAFGYFVGLPATLTFLLHQFHTSQIHPLLTIDEYLSFVTLYMFAAAMMFQLPLIILFIDRVHPLNPHKMLRYERWVILLSVIWSAVLNPTTNIIAMFAVAIPIVVTYQLSIGVIWWIHSHGKRQKISELLKTDALIQEQRQQRAAALKLEPALKKEDLTVKLSSYKLSPAIDKIESPSMVSAVKPARSSQNVSPVRSTVAVDLRSRYRHNYTRPNYRSDYIS